MNPLPWMLKHKFWCLVVDKYDTYFSYMLLSIRPVFVEFVQAKDGVR